MPAKFEGRRTVYYLDPEQGTGEVVFETTHGEELWSMRPNRTKGVWERDTLLRKRRDCAMSAAINNRTRFPKADEFEVTL